MIVLYYNLLIKKTSPILKEQIIEVYWKRMARAKYKYGI